MNMITGVKPSETVEISQVLDGKLYDQPIKMNGTVHTIRDMSEFAFVVLRKREGLVQTVFTKNEVDFDMKELHEGTTVEIEGVAHVEDRAPNGFEVKITGVKVLSQPAAQMPIAIGKWKLKETLETKLDLRAVSLRNVRERAVFRIQEGIIRGFREFLFEQGFTEIHTPKIVAAGAEGGSNVFKLEYFRKKAFLAQSPQTYKQMMIPVYDRVFEAGPVFRAEKHSTKRHINEYTSMDFEMGFINSFEDIMAMEAGMLQYVMKLLEEKYAREIKILGIELPDAGNIPAVRFDVAKQEVAEHYNRNIRNPYDLEPEEEELISKLYKEKTGSDFVFVTHYPSKKRPFYAMDDPEDKTFTLSFDLLFKGIEITTGGQRIHDYNEQIAKMQERGMDPDEFKGYLMAHKHGMPPHGGLGIGLERLTMKLLDKDNIRETTMFPRDINRLEP